VNVNNIKYYAFPRTVAEAMVLLSNKRYKAMAVAGGTLVSKTLPDTVETYLDLKNLPIKGIKISGGSLVIGAGASFDEIDRSRLCRSWAGGVISAAAEKCSSQLIRNMATIGGNIARPHSFNIFPVVLLGLDAKVKVVSKAGAKTVDFAGLYAPGFSLKPGLDCILTEVLIPAKTRNWHCEFIKLAKTESSWESYITLFFAAQKKGKTISQARVAIGALRPKPFRAQAVENAITSALSVPEAARAAAAVFAREEAAAGEYRVSASAQLLKRFVLGMAK
jgi:CO/xanthine dehydrogenase FAD-binding subunit